MSKSFREELKAAYAKLAENSSRVPVLSRPLPQVDEVSQRRTMKQYKQVGLVKVLSKVKTIRKQGW